MILPNPSPELPFTLAMTPSLPCPGDRVTFEGTLPKGERVVLFIGPVVDPPHGKVSFCLPRGSQRLGEANVGPDRQFHIESTIPRDLGREGYYNVYVYGGYSLEVEPFCNGYDAKFALCGYLDPR